MARSQTHVLGLDIGTSAIKAVELQKTGSGVELIGRPMVVPTPERSVEDGVIVDPAAVSEALRELVGDAHFKTRHAIASVGGTSSVVVRITEVPKMSGKELDEAIQWELDRQTPFPIEQTFFDYKPIDLPDADPNAQDMEVLIAVAQEDMINAHVDVLNAAKLLPEAIDVEPLAITRSLVEIGGSAYADQTIGVLHVGHNASIILVIRRGLLAFVRYVPNAGAALTQSITQNFMGDEELAEQVKKALADVSESLFPEDAAPEVGYDDPIPQGEADSVFEESDMLDGVGAEEPIGPEAEATQLDMVSPDEADLGETGQESAPAAELDEAAQRDVSARQIVYEAIATPLVDLASEVQASLNFYRRQHRNEEVDRMFLSGGSAVIPGLAAFVEAETGVPVENADPFAELETDESETPPEYLRDIGPSMVIAVGLALRDMVD